MRFFLIILCTLTLALPAQAQNSKKVKDLKKQRERLQKELKTSQQELERTRKDITSHKKVSKQLDVQLEERLEGIRVAEERMNDLDRKMDTLQSHVGMVNGKLEEKKDKYARALRMARAYRHVQSPTLFILSARKLMQMSRRARNTNYFASILRNMGEELLAKQGELLSTQNKLLSAKSEMNTLMRNVMQERHELGVQQVEQQRQIESLNSKEKNLQSKLSKQRTQLAQLNKTIDAVVAAEVEAARKRAEAARRKAEEARRKAEAQRKKGKTGGKSSSKESQTEVPSTWLTPEDKALNGSFEQNRGRLPVPITGSYMLGERYGRYNVPGMTNVQLDNKGVNYIGKNGAKARAVFDGEVTAVFKFYNTKGVLIRHGSYISVYCNLAAVQVNKGQKVRARDLIGTLAHNEDGKCILHFQLRKETATLNPEKWIGR